MEKTFYTNVAVRGSRILYRGVQNGKHVMNRVDYHPTLFVRSDKPTRFTTIHGDYVAPIKPGNIRECRDFVRQYEGVDNFTIYGNQRYEYCFISDEFPGSLDPDTSLIRVANLDIEVGSENGFPEPETASEPLTAITVKMNGKFVTFGCGHYESKRPDAFYYQCADEFDLVMKFLGWWESEYPDIVTGWNVEQFDIPYLVNRIKNLYGERVAQRLSPWHILGEKTVENMGRKSKVYSILGVAILDMILLFKRYDPHGFSQESYKLDAIANYMLGERKLSYEEYGNLHNLYKENYEMFIDYNIRDVELVDRINEKGKFIDLALILSYDNKCNFEDVFAQVRMWDVICFHHLKSKNKVVPPMRSQDKDSAYVGAYVKDPLVGFHNWVASFDVNSEYPSVIMGSNISTETIVEPADYTPGMRSILASGITVDRLLERQVVLDQLKEDNVCLTANGQFYRRDSQGFMPELVEKMFADRKRYKNTMIDAEKELQVTNDPAKREDLKRTISKYNILQLAKKVSLNSLYGALGSQYFRFYDLRNAIAVTTTGQLTIRWIEKAINEYLNKILKTENDYVIAVDTDSVYLHLALLVCKTIGENVEPGRGIAFLDKVCATGIQPVIDKACSDLSEYTNVYQNKIAMKREVLADKAIWTAKKRYILNVHNSEGVQYAQPKKKVMGLELVKSSTPSYCRVKLKEAVDLIFAEGEAAVQEFVKQVREDFRKQPLADISFPRGMNGLQKWKNDKTIYGSGTPIHVRGALMYNHILKGHKLTQKYPLIQTGEKLKYIYLKEPNTIQSNVISFPQGGIPEEFDLHKYIDWDLQFDKAFLEPLKIILEAINWKHEKTSSLEDFWS